MADRGVLLVPQKDLDQAKSRMQLSPPRRRDLAVSMLRRTLTAAAGVRFTAVVVVLDNPADAREIHDRDVTPFTPEVAGLNESLVVAEEFARVRWGAVRLAVMPADLPLATAPLLDTALRLAARHERAFLPDISARGTTLLFAGKDAALKPAYGPHSAHAHEGNGARRLRAPGLDHLRHDVDDMADFFTVNLRSEEARNDGKRQRETA